MRLTILKSRAEQATTMLTVIMIGALVCLAASSMLVMSSTAVSNSGGRVDWNKAFFITENAMVWGAQAAFDASPGPGTSNYYSTAAGSLPIGQLISSSNRDVTVSGAWVTIVQPTNLPNNVYTITASSKVNSKVRTIQAQVAIRPTSQVFDFEYFLNNWGWWWGNTITGDGAQRANWDFDFRYSPTVNGSIYAADQVDENELPVQDYASPPFNGTAGSDMTNLVHQGAPRVTMPNLLDFSNYVATAMTNTASNGLWVGTNQIVYGVLGTNLTSSAGGNSGNITPQQGLYVVGTASNPIKIKGTVVIPGDVVLQGVVTGQGTLYVGGNLYVASNVTYLHGPDFSSAPETQSASTRDTWVSDSQTNDLVAYAVRGSILGGDVTDPDWIDWCFWYPGSGLAYVGDESQLGQDGIEGTGDDNVPFLHANGTMSTWYDADGDGRTNANYNYNNDINMTASRASYIQGYPTNSSGPLAYNQVATDNMGTLEGIYYTDHAAAIREDQDNSTIHGVIVSRNEQMVFQVYLDIIYDSRVNSRYNNNPNQFINLGLPWGKPVQVNSFAELPPNATGL